MTGTDELPEATNYDDWTWVIEHPSVFDDDGRMSFIRGVTPDEVFAAYGVPVESVREMTLLESWGHESSAGAETACLRVAVSGDWVIVMEPIRAGSLSTAPLDRLAVDHDFVTVNYDEMGPNHASCQARDGRGAGFLLGQSYHSLAGPSAERFDGLMREAGLLPVPTPYSILEEVVLALAMMAREFGFTLSPEVVRGPLPTAPLPG
ncbi:hypothetical protein [Amycolatopsis taiwanensis]|uniref:Uncharacterized protein n=1 Tax=Amycolatopsis taiwanensis TaxID=342230 RepID=A0A9W6R6J0_9PSEU|nr:hypothetical protein [Amycolatopsis taiwanensis]GLY70346.1 hypothetical protein Atai01_69650 [Amycolatopsis taiwanensis]